MWDFQRTIGPKEQFEHRTLFLEILPVRQEEHALVIGAVFRGEYAPWTPREMRGAFHQLGTELYIEAIGMS